jgi:hypothetical protein
VREKVQGVGAESGGIGVDTVSELEKVEGLGAESGGDGRRYG